MSKIKYSRQKKINRADFWGSGFSFWLTFFLFLVAVTALFLASYFYISINKYDELQSYIPPLADSFSIILGLPVALAGSAVAIILAHKSLSISRRQEYYENISFIDEYVEDVYSRYAEVSSCLREYLSDVSSLMALYIDQQENPDNEEEFKKSFFSLKENVISSRRDFIQKLSYLSRNRVCSQIWVEQSAKDQGSLLRKVVFEILDDNNENKINIHEVMRHATSINDYLFFMGTPTFNNDFMGILESYYFITEEDDEGRLVTFTPEEVGADILSMPWNLILLGGLVLSTKKVDKYSVSRDEFYGVDVPNLDHSFSANYGAALVCDFVKWCPDSVIARDAIIHRLHSLINIDSALRHYVEKVIENKNFDDLCPQVWKISAEMMRDNPYKIFNSEFDHIGDYEIFEKWCLKNSYENGTLVVSNK
nr:hypothetical protein [Halomonas sp. UBA3074]